MALSIFAFSFTFALAMMLFLAVLVFRRARHERAAPELAEAERRVTRSYLQRMSDARACRDVAAPTDVRLHAVAHLARLLRGAERDSLMALAEGDGLLDAPIAALRSGRLKRRADAVQILENFGTSRCVQALTELMIAESDEGIQLEAASALARLGKLPPPGALISLLKLHGKALNRVHLALFRSLAPTHYAEIGELATRPRFTALRPMLVEALGWSSNRTAFDDLAPWSTHPDAAVRQAALMAAQHIGHHRAAAWVLTRLDDKDPAVRVTAVETVQKLGLVAALPIVRGMLHDPATWVAVHAERAVAALSTQQRPAPVQGG